jgi:hypothetical protein
MRLSNRQDVPSCDVTKPDTGLSRTTATTRKLAEVGACAGSRKQLSSSSDEWRVGLAPYVERARSVPRNPGGISSPTIRSFR